MKRVGFKRKTLEEVRTKQASKPKPSKNKKIKDKWASVLTRNIWYKSIPEGSHGSNTIEKRLWRLVTDYVRICDFEDYGTCISCNEPFTTWNESQGGHYRPFGKCKGYKKYDFRNVFGQCAFCNSRMNEDKFEGGRIFAENIIARHGERRLTYINTFTSEEWSCKREVPVLLDMMLEILTLMKTRKTKPDYYKKLSTITYLH